MALYISASFTLVPGFNSIASAEKDGKLQYNEKQFSVRVMDDAADCSVLRPKACMHLQRNTCATGN